MDRVIPITEGFWNIRGSFKILRLLDVGTQASLAGLSSGGFVLLDSYTLTGEVAQEVLRLTDGGRKIEAVLNLHPFHTIHVGAVASAFPHAKLYGTARHHTRFPELAWEAETTESEAFRSCFAEDFDFMVPAGVDFIPDNENLHFASVLAFHKASRTLHVDDTLNWTPVPIMKGVSFHPTLGQVLQRREGAAREFREWARALVERCREVDNLCTAHARLAPQDKLRPIARQIEGALARVEGTLAKHERRYG